MPNWFYINTNGKRQGPINDLQLKALTARGIVTPTTPLETDKGHKGLAGQLLGLFNVPPTQSLTSTASQAVPHAEGSETMLWTTLASVFALLIISGIGLTMMLSPDPVEQAKNANPTPDQQAVQNVLPDEPTNDLKTPQNNKQPPQDSEHPPTKTVDSNNPIADSNDNLWKGVTTYGRGTSFSRDNSIKSSGDYALRIQHSDYADSAFRKTIPVEKNTTYRVSAMARYEGYELSPDNAGGIGGANISIWGEWTLSERYTGSEWKRIVLEFNSGNKTEVDLALRNGFFGRLAKERHGFPT